MSQLGLGLRPLHYEAILSTRPKIDFFECLTEDYIQLSGDDFLWLEKIRACYPVSLHGVSLSIGSTDPLNRTYLKALKKLIDHVNPISVSDHFCWTGINNINTHDLLPLPYTNEAINHLVSRIHTVQEFLGRQIMLENVSSYATFSDNEMSEWEFITEVAKRADCFILLDINNIYVNAFNHHFSAEKYLQHIPRDRVKQFHLAGHKHCQTHIIDTHDDAIVDNVWDLYAKAVAYFGDVPLIIERDSNIPPLETLMLELEKARNLDQSRQGDARVSLSRFVLIQANVKLKKMISLKQFQKNFQSYILENDAQIKKNITPSKNLTPSQQIQIYQNAYCERIIAALMKDFPIMVTLLGESAFSSLVQDYISHYPSTDFNLRYIGKDLAHFILSKDPSFITYSELARLEYVMCLADSSSEINFESDYNVVELYNFFYATGGLVNISLRKKE